jgi:uncharacterized protein
MKNKYNELKEAVEPGVFTQWQEVDAQIIAFTDLGAKVAINNEYIGLVYANEMYDDYREGQPLKAYIKCIRDDGRIDVSLQPRQSGHIVSTAEKILAHLKAAGGKAPFSDTSSPEDIRNTFQVSKKVFKQAIGKLYKQRLIKITEAGLELAAKRHTAPRHRP